MTDWSSWPARRPVAALVVSALLILLSLVAVRRLRPDASLEKMMSKDDPAVGAAVRVLNEFPAAEELLVLATAPKADCARKSRNEAPTPSGLRLHGAADGDRDVPHHCRARSPGFHCKYWK